MLIKIAQTLHKIPDHKGVGDVAATVSGLGAFSAVTMSWLQGISLILAIIASLFSIGWMVFRAVYFWRHGIKP